MMKGLIQRLKVLLLSAGGITLSVADEKTVKINKSLELDSINAPSSTSNQLYNVGGTLTWNGTELGSGSGAVSAVATVPIIE